MLNAVFPNRVPQGSPTLSSQSSHPVYLTSYVTSLYLVSTLGFLKFSSVLIELKDFVSAFIIAVIEVSQGIHTQTWRYFNLGYLAFYKHFLRGNLTSILRKTCFRILTHKHLSVFTFTLHTGIEILLVKGIFFFPSSVLELICKTQNSPSPFFKSHCPLGN